MAKQQLISATEAAAILGVSVASVANMRKRGDLVAERVGPYAYDARAVKRLAAKRAKDPKVQATMKRAEALRGPRGGRVAV